MSASPGRLVMGGPVVKRSIKIYQKEMKEALEAYAFAKLGVPAPAWVSFEQKGSIIVPARSPILIVTLEHLPNVKVLPVRAK